METGLEGKHRNQTRNQKAPSTTQLRRDCGLEKESPAEMELHRNGEGRDAKGKTRIDSQLIQAWAYCKAICYNGESWSDGHRSGEKKTLALWMYQWYFIRYLKLNVVPKSRAHPQQQLWATSTCKDETCKGSKSEGKRGTQRDNPTGRSQLGRMRFPKKPREPRISITMGEWTLSTPVEKVREDAARAPEFDHGSGRSSSPFSGSNNLIA